MKQCKAYEKCLETLSCTQVNPVATQSSSMILSAKICGEENLSLSLFARNAAILRSCASRRRHKSKYNDKKRSSTREFTWAREPGKGERTKRDRGGVVKRNNKRQGVRPRARAAITRSRALSPSYSRFYARTFACMAKRCRVRNRK